MVSHDVKVVATDAAATDYFGEIRSCAGVSSSAFAVGAYHDDDMGSDSGAAYVFTNNSGSWVQAEKLLVSDGASSDYFGRTMAALSQSTLAISSFFDDDMGSDSGSIYLFTKNNDSWAQSDKLTASDGASSDYFGYGCAGLSSSILVVGSYYDDDDGSQSGSAYIFTSNSGGTWVQADKVLASDGASLDYFGNQVSKLSNSSFVVSAYGDDDEGSYSGATYVFTSYAGSWLQSDKIVPSDVAAGDVFGFGISDLSSQKFVASSYNDDCCGSSNLGSAYVFSQ
ncbi:unnamed protein product, partial [Heterosigma akashiwo]